MSVERFRPTVTNVQATALCGALPEGVYVKWSDYDAAQQRISELEAALRLAQYAMRAPLDDWKGEVERKALDAARAAYTAYADASAYAAAAAATRKACCETHKDLLAHTEKDMTTRVTITNHGPDELLIRCYDEDRKFSAKADRVKVGESHDVTCWNGNLPVLWPIGAGVTDGGTGWFFAVPPATF